jgi:hypothetical protein
LCRQAPQTERRQASPDKSIQLPQFIDQMREAILIKGVPCQLSILVRRHAETSK